MVDDREAYSSSVSLASSYLKELLEDLEAVDYDNMDKKYFQERILCKLKLADAFLFMASTCLE